MCSFKQIISCDLPPNISKNESVCCDVSLIDFLGCDTHLDEKYPFLEFGTALFLEFFLQGPKHITSRKEHIGDGAYMKTCMFLIQEENFSYKSLKRFKHQVVSFLNYLTFWTCVTS